jgi:hypothetical protein
MVKKGDDWDRRLAAFAALVHLPRSARRKGDGGEVRAAATHLREAAMALRDGLASIATAKTFGTAARALADLARRFIDVDDRRDDALGALANLSAADDAGLPFDAAYFRARAAEIARAQKEDEAGGDALTLLDWPAARGLRFRVVFAPGCVEGAVPLPPRQDPVLLNDERDALAVAADAPGALPTTADRAREELRLFDLVCRVAGERLLASFPRTDPASGRPRLPSHLLAGLASRLGVEMRTAADYTDFTDRVSRAGSASGAGADAETLDDDERDLCAMSALAGVDPLAPIHYLLGARPAAFPRVWQRQQNRWARDGLTAHEGWCESGAGAQRAVPLPDGVVERESWSVGDLERYALCPRRYLFERLLRLERPVDPETVVALPPNERGSLIHRALEQLTKQPRRDVRALVAELYGEKVAENLTGGGVLDEIERERLTAWTRAMADFVAEQSGGRPAVSENPVEMKFALAGGPNITIKGRLDRVEAGDATRIIDFKTGKAKSRFRDGGLQDDSFNAGSTLQLPLYLLLWAAANPADRQLLHAAYWHLKNKQGEVKPTAVCFGPDFLPNHAMELRRALAMIFDDLRRRHFAPRPDLAADAGNPYCARCDFTVICDARGRARLAVKMAAGAPYPWLGIVGRFDDAEK